MAQKLFNALFAQKLFECPICYEEGELVMKAPCGHKICAHCCKRTCEELNKKCPLCRALLPGDLNDYEITTRIDFENLNVQQIQNIFPFICSGGNLAHVKQCVEQFKIDINKTGVFVGTTALLESSENGHHSIVEFLVLNGADVNQATQNGHTPLFVSSQNGHFSIVNFLVQNGVHINQARNDGVTPLLVSSQNGYLPIVKFLVQNGADVNQACVDGSTPLLLSSKHGHFFIVEFLVQNGADVNQVHENGVSSLLISSLGGHLTIVKCLLQNGADVKKASSKLNPFAASILTSHNDVAELLRQHGANTGNFYY